MVSQPDGFIKCTDAAGPCQGQEGKGLGQPCQAGAWKGEPRARKAPTSLGGEMWWHFFPAPSPAKSLPLLSSTPRIRFQTNFLQEVLQD